MMPMPGVMAKYGYLPLEGQVVDSSIPKDREEEGQQVVGYLPEDGEVKQTEYGYLPEDGEVKQTEYGYHPEDGEVKQTEYGYHPEDGEVKQTEYGYHPLEGEEGHQTEYGYLPLEDTSAVEVDPSDFIPVSETFGLIIFLIIVLIAVFLYGRILNKAGYSKWWSILIFIPVVNLIMIWVFAFSNWPNQKNINLEAVKEKKQSRIDPKKKDRIAIVLSIFWLGFVVSSEMAYGSDFWQELLTYGLPVWVYWAYRYIFTK